MEKGVFKLAVLQTPLFSKEETNLQNYSVKVEIKWHFYKDIINREVEATNRNQVKINLLYFQKALEIVEQFWWTNIFPQSSLHFLSKNIFYYLLIECIFV